jgi:hypothetical protein
MLKKNIKSKKKLINFQVKNTLKNNHCYNINTILNFNLNRVVI